MTELLSNPVVWGLGTCVAGGLVFRVLKRRGVKVEPVASTWSSQRIVSTGSLLSEFVHIRVTDKQPVVTRVLVNGHMIAAGPATLEARR